MLCSPYMDIPFVVIDAERPMVSRDPTGTSTQFDTQVLLRFYSRMTFLRAGMWTAKNLTASLYYYTDHAGFAIHKS